MISIIFVLAVAAGVAAQPPSENVEQPRLRECQGGLRVRLDEYCPPIVDPPPMIFFGFDEVALTERARRTLEYIAFEQLQLAREGRTEPARVVLEGHTDRSGASAYNLNLSRRRADAARAFLISHGYPPEAVAVTAFGESRPSVTNEDGQRDPNNRNVVIKIDPPLGL
jgi:outer membrane protein OmpA-like peptidoglycan-associated protein